MFGGSYAHFMSEEERRLEEDIELIKRKVRKFRFPFERISKEIGAERLKEILTKLYYRKGAMDQVADMLGVSHPTIQKWARDLGIPVASFPPKTKFDILGFEWVDGYDYPMPRLRLEEFPECDKAWLAGLYEGEGYFTYSKSRKEKTASPISGIGMTDLTIMRKVARMLGVRKLIERELKDGKRMYYARLPPSIAVALAHKLLPYMTRGSEKWERAKKIADTYRKKLAVPMQE